VDSGWRALVELFSRNNHFYNWRLDDDSLPRHMEALWRCLVRSILSRCLHYDGRCTFRPRAGLVLCELVMKRASHRLGTYLDAYDRFRKTDNTCIREAKPLSFELGNRTVSPNRSRGRGSTRHLISQMTRGSATSLRHCHGPRRVYESRPFASCEIRQMHARGWVQLSVAALNRRPSKTHECG